MGKNHVVFKCTYLFLIFFLFLIGYRTVENPTMIISKQQEGIVAEAEQQNKSNIEQILEKRGCLLNPEKKGVMIERAENLELPKDSELEDWKVYEFKENNKKGIEEQIGKTLLGTYFPKAEKADKDYGEYKIYRLNYRDEEVSFYFQFLSIGKEINYTHRSNQIEIEKSEDEDWETAYLQYDKELLKQLQLGMWDGEQGYLELVQQQNLRTELEHRYNYSMDGKEFTDVDFNFQYNMMPYVTRTSPIIFRYRDGVLTSLEECNQYNELETIRDAEIKYTSMEEILKEIEKKLRITYLLDYSEENQMYHYFCIEGIKISYMRYCYGKLEKKYAFVPVAEVELTGYFYDLKTKKWSEYIPKLYYGLQLETGEGSIGGKF